MSHGKIYILIYYSTKIAPKNIERININNTFNSVLMCSVFLLYPLSDDIMGII